MLKIPNESGATNIGNKPSTQKVRCSAFTIELKYVISTGIILSYIYIVSICIGYAIKENEIVKIDIKCLFEGKTRRCIMGSTVSRACVGLAEIIQNFQHSSLVHSVNVVIASIARCELNSNMCVRR